MVVRAWLDGERLTVRLLASGDRGDHTIVVTSIDDACRELARVLLAFTIWPVGDGEGDSPGTRP